MDVAGCTQWKRRFAPNALMSFHWVQAIRRTQCNESVPLGAFTSRVGGNLFACRAGSYVVSLGGFCAVLASGCVNVRPRKGQPRCAFGREVGGSDVRNAPSSGLPYGHAKTRRSTSNFSGSPAPACRAFPGRRPPAKFGSLHLVFAKPTHLAFAPSAPPPTPYGCKDASQGKAEM